MVMCWLFKLYLYIALSSCVVCLPVALQNKDKEEKKEADPVYHVLEGPTPIVQEVRVRCKEAYKYLFQCMV